jgi:hypothetical protein
VQHTPVNRIQRVLALAGVLTRRSPRWVDEINASHIAHLDTSRNALIVK